MPEVWVIDRDSRAVEIHALRVGKQDRIAPGPDGWLHSAATGIQLRPERERKLGMQMAGDTASLRLLPDAGNG